jgi:hypothetical protein
MAYAVIFRPILGSFNLYMIPSDGKKAFYPKKEHYLSSAPFCVTLFSFHYRLIGLSRDLRVAREPKRETQSPSIKPAIAGVPPVIWDRLDDCHSDGLLVAGSVSLLVLPD